VLDRKEQMAKRKRANHKGQEQSGLLANQDKWRECPVASGALNTVKVPASTLH
jgi:hypothetical protein